MTTFQIRGSEVKEPRAAPLTTPDGTSGLGLAHDHSIVDTAEPSAMTNSLATAEVQESEYKEYRIEKHTIPTIVFDHTYGSRFIFINGARVEPNNFPIWLGYDILDPDPRPGQVSQRENAPEPLTISELIFDEDGDGKTVSIIVPLGTIRCPNCNELFVSHGSLDKHLNTQHSDWFRMYRCKECKKAHPRFRPAAVHHSLCLTKKRQTPRIRTETEMQELTEGLMNLAGTEEASAEPETVAHTETPESTPTPPEVTEGTMPVVPEVTKGVKCEVCGKVYKTRSGLSQHERHAHPDLRNTKRIEAGVKDKERKRLARETIKEATAQATGVRPKSKGWTEEDTNTLEELCKELAGTKNINAAIVSSGRLPNKSAKQISDKRAQLGLRPKKATGPARERLDTTVPDQPRERSIPAPMLVIEAIFRNTIYAEGKEGMAGESANILLKALDGGEVEMLHEQFLERILEKCAKPPKKKGPERPQKTDLKGKRTRKRNDYKRIQRRYDLNPSMVAKEILDNKPEATKCEIDPEVVFKTYSERFGGTSQEVALDPYPNTKPVDNFALLQPITIKEVKSALSRANKDTASGPDGVRITDLVNLDDATSLIANVFNLWLYSKKVPERVKTNRSILLPKGTENLQDVNNWRPLTISSILLRLYTNILAQRLGDLVPLNPRQRGFIKAPGCSENQVLMQRVIRHAKRNRKQLCVVLLDLAKAFDTVSHHHIRAGLERFGIDKHFIEIVQDLYQNAATHFELATGKTESIPITRGVKQGDPLSPVLFNIAMDPLLAALSAAKNGYRWDESELQLEALCYADDNGLLTQETAEMQSNLDIVNKFCGDTGMQLNVKKSTGFSIKPGAKHSYVVNDFEPKWTVNGQVLPLMAPSEGAKYLGVDISAWTGVVRADLHTKLETWCQRIGNAPLKPRQKVDILRQYALSRLSYYLSQVDYPQSKLEDMDCTVRRWVKKWLHLPECTTDHILYSANEKGGLGLPRLRLAAPCSRINMKRKVLISSDESTRAFALADGVAQEVTMTAQKLGIKIPTNPKRSAKWRDIEVKAWRKLKVAGKGHRSFCHQSSNTWLRPKRNHFTESDFITGLQVRADTYPTKATLARASGSDDIMCRRCKAAPETVGHISGQCPATKGYRINRHNGIVNILADRLKTAGWTVAKEPRVVDSENNTFIPDIIAVKGMEAVVIDPTIVYENSDTSLQSANTAKTRKYEHLADTIKARFGCTKASFHGLAIGARGGWTSSNTKILALMGLRDKGFYALLCRYALRGTINMLRVFQDKRGRARPS